MRSVFPESRKLKSERAGLHWFKKLQGGPQKAKPETIDIFNLVLKPSTQPWRNNSIPREQAKISCANLSLCKKQHNWIIVVAPRRPKIRKTHDSVGLRGRKELFVSTNHKYKISELRSQAESKFNPVLARIRHCPWSSCGWVFCLRQMILTKIWRADDLSDGKNKPSRPSTRTPHRFWQRSAFFEPRAVAISPVRRLSAKNDKTDKVSKIQPTNPTKASHSTSKHNTHKNIRHKGA